MTEHLPGDRVQVLTKGCLNGFVGTVVRPDYSGDNVYSVVVLDNTNNPFTPIQPGKARVVMIKNTHLYNLTEEDAFLKDLQTWTPENAQLQSDKNLGSRQNPIILD